MFRNTAITFATASAGVQALKSGENQVDATINTPGYNGENPVVATQDVAKQMAMMKDIAGVMQDVFTATTPKETEAAQEKVENIKNKLMDQLKAEDPDAAKQVEAMTNNVKAILEDPETQKKIEVGAKQVAQQLKDFEAIIKDPATQQQIEAGAKMMQQMVAPMVQKMIEAHAAA